MFLMFSRVKSKFLTKKLFFKFCFVIEISISVFGGYVFLKFLGLKSIFWTKNVFNFWAVFLMGDRSLISEITPISMVILKTWENGEFKELLISRKLLEIEPNRSFLEVMFFWSFRSWNHNFWKKKLFSNSAL